MKKFMLFIGLLFSVFCFSGCTVKYNLLIDSKKRVTENVSLLDFNDNFLKYSPSVKDFLNTYSKNFEGYSVKNVITKSESGYNLTKKYPSIEAYKKSKFFQNAFEDAIIEDTDDVYKFNTSGEYYRNNIFTVPLESVFRYSIDEVEVNIKFYNEVLTHNADKVDKSNNTYTWIIKKEDSFKSIEFNLSDKVRNDLMIKDFISENKLLLLIFGGIIFVVVMCVKGFFGIMERNNKI